MPTLDQRRCLRFSMLALCCAWSSFLALPQAALAQAAYPQRAVRLIVPFPPGGAGDIVGRLVGEKLGEALRQPVLIDNRGGGGQVIATELAANAAPDGYTLFLASATHTINPALQKKLPYDTIKAFASITMVVESPLVFVAHPALGVSNIRELVAAAKSRPGAINYATSGPGTGGHLSVELLKRMTGIDLVHVPYKGAAPALLDVISGQVQIMCTSPLPAMPHVKTGKLRALAMTGKARSASAPDIPTVAETVPGYESTLWYSLLAPAGTPQSVVMRLHAEMVKLLAAPEMQKQIAALGGEPTSSTPQELDKKIRTEIANWIQLVREAKITAE